MLEAEESIEQFNLSRLLSRSHTGLDDKRLWVLWSLAQQSSKLSSGSLIEVGSHRGGSALVMMLSARLAGVSDEFYVCDTFRGLVKSDATVDLHHDGESSGVLPGIVEDLFFFCRIDATILPGVFPDETGERVIGSRFRLAHIDVDTYRSAKDSFEFLWPRMVCGGVVVFDDYGERDCPGITKLIDELQSLSGCLWQFHDPLQAVAVKVS